MATAAVARRFCVAPMMRYSHCHARQFWRRLCPQALLYTEMLTADAVIHGDRDRLLGLPEEQSPVALQLGGSCAPSLAQAAKIGESFGYAEINLNCGCPSERVQHREIGACLMASPARVAGLVAAMKDAVRLPVTVKCRLAIDGTNDEEDLDEFISAIVDAGCDAVIVHARRAWLDGLNPAQNRSVPPLDWRRVRRLQESFPSVPIVLNGGLQTMADIEAQLPFVAGVMIGREICRRPYLLAEISERIFDSPPVLRRFVLADMLRYVRGLPTAEWRRALMPLAGLYHGVANNKYYRRQLSLAPQAALQNLETNGKWA